MSSQEKPTAFRRGSVTHKYCPDQSMLGKFMAGLPTKPAELPPPPPKKDKFGRVKVREPEEEFHHHRRVELPDEFPLENREYPFNDMMRGAANILKFDITGVRILVCPKCKMDLKPVFSKPSNLKVGEGETLLFYDDRIERQCSFCECLKCKTAYFLPEVVALGNFRLLMPNEDSSAFYDYLFEVWFKGSWMVMLGATIQDVTGSPSGNTYVRLDHLFRCIASEDGPDILQQEALLF